MQLLGEVKYAPARDIVHILPSIIQTAMEQMIAGERMPDLQKWLKSQGVTEDEIEEAFNAYCGLLAAAKDQVGVKITKAMDDSGWLAVRWQTRVAVMFFLSYNLTGVFYKGAQAAYDETHGIPSIAGMLQVGQDLTTYMGMSWWRRWLYRRRRDRVPLTFNG